MSRAFGAFRAATMGEQEDAQEFLAFFLDQLHEEVVEAKKKWPDFGGLGGGADGSRASSAGAAGRGGGGAREEEDDWLEVGKGGAKAVVNAPDPRQKVSTSSVVRLVFCVLCFVFFIARVGFVVLSWPCLSMPLCTGRTTAADSRLSPSSRILAFRGDVGHVSVGSLFKDVSVSWRCWADMHCLAAVAILPRILLGCCRTCPAHVQR